MKIVKLFVACALVAAVAGCGGGSGNAPLVNRLAGFYTGTWSDTQTPPHSGTMTLGVAADNGASGTLTDTTTGLQGAMPAGFSVVGANMNGGNSALTIRFNGGTASEFDWQATGNLLSSTSSGLSGDLNVVQLRNQAPWIMHVVLTKQ